MRIRFFALTAGSAAIVSIGLLQPCLSDSASIVVSPKGYSPRTADAESAQGKEYFEKLACSKCHSINNVGGHIGPVLDGIGQRRRSEFLQARLADDKAAIEKFSQLTGRRSTDIPPHPREKDKVAHALVAYLLTLPEPAGGFRITPHVAQPAAAAPAPSGAQNATADAASIAAGEKLYEKFGCAQCHAIQGVGGDLGPALDGISTLHDRDYVMAHITNAQVVAEQNSPISAIVPTPMPKFTATQKEIRQIADYLMSLPSR